MSNNISFSILTKDLSSQLSICNQVSPKKSEVDLFTQTRVEVSADGLQLAATNGSLYYIAKLKLQNSELLPQKYLFLVKTEAINNIVSLINDEFVTFLIDLEKLTLVIKGEKTKHQLRISKDTVENYKLPSINNEQVNIRLRLKTDEMTEANKACNISVGGKSMYQPEFWNICYTVKPKNGKVNIVSTDRHRITKNTLEADIMFASDDMDVDFINYLIPPKTLQLVSSSVSNQENVEIVFETNLIYILIDKNTIISRYGEGKYADYEKIIPATFACSFEASTDQFISSLKQVFWCVRNDLNKSINIDVNPPEKVITLTSKNSDGEKAEAQVSIENYQGVEEVWNQSFNGDYITDYINIIKTEKFLWEANPGKLSVLSPEGEKEKQFYLVTGLR